MSRQALAASHGSSAAAGAAAEGPHDGLNRRIRRYAPTLQTWTVGEFYYDNEWKLLEYRSTANVTRPPDEPAVGTILKEQYVWSERYIDAPVLRDRDHDNNANTGDYGQAESGLEQRLYSLGDANFKEFIRLCGMTHVRTSPNYPQSNGKKERWYQTLKSECIRPQTPLSLEDARRIVARFVGQYNTVRLHSAIGYIAPKDKLEGRAEAILAAREAKLAAAREQRAARRRQVPDGQATDTNAFLTKEKTQPTMPMAGETDASSAGEQLARDSRSGCGRKAGAEMALRGHPRAPDEPFGTSPHASENSDLPQASRTLTDAGQMSISG